MDRPRPEAAAPRRPARRPLDRDPRPPRSDVIAGAQGRLLDPATALIVDGVVAAPDGVRRARGCSSRSRWTSTARWSVLRAVAEPLGWDVVPEEEDPRTVNLRFGVHPGAPGRRSNRATIAPDAWTLLQQTRAQFGVDSVKGVSLDHLRGAGDRGEPDARRQPDARRTPVHDGNPFTMRPVHDATRCTTGTRCTTRTRRATRAAHGRSRSYLQIGFGGRQPVAYVGPAPRRRPDETIDGPAPGGGDPRHRLRRAPVARRRRRHGRHAGRRADRLLRRHVDSPEDDGDQSGPLDGSIDPISGHGTFIAGLVRQRCPDADIVAWRVMPSDGPIVESDLVATLAQIAELARRHRAGEPGGHPIDVLSLSMGYYHETPEDELFDPTHVRDPRGAGPQRRRRRLLGRQRRHQPAVLPGRLRAAGPTTAGRSRSTRRSRPIVSVGALNPNRTDALFSNAGPWVRAYVPGAAVVSTMPAFRGRLRAGRADAAPSTASARRSTPTTSAAGSRSGAVRRSARRSWPATSPRRCSARLETVDAPVDGPTAVAPAWNAVSRLHRIGAIMSA